MEQNHRGIHLVLIISSSPSIITYRRFNSHFNSVNKNWKIGILRYGWDARSTHNVNYGNIRVLDNYVGQVSGECIFVQWTKLKFSSTSTSPTICDRFSLKSISWMPLFDFWLSNFWSSTVKNKSKIQKSNSFACLIAMASLTTYNC